MKTVLCVVCLAILACPGGLAIGGPLDPLAYPTYGPLALGSGTAVLSTSGDPTLTANGITYAGLIVGGVAVFDFNGITIGPGASLVGSGSLPLALLSRGDVSIGGTIDVSGMSTTSTAATAAGGPGGGAGGSPDTVLGGGPGGSAGFPFLGVAGGGGGFGGVGGTGTPFLPSLPDSFHLPTEAYPGGPTYGNLAVVLQGGSGGGGGGGGAGGGGIEIGAAGKIAFSQGGLIDAHGGSSVNSMAWAGYAGSGGGSGGGIFLHASTVSFDSTNPELNAAGGDGGGPGILGGPGGGFGGEGGGGGGGRILIESSSSITGVPLYDINGGGQGTAAGGVGTFGVVAVPEPSSLALLAIGAVGLFARSRLGRRG